MSFRLFEHQTIALPILKRMEREGRGGILADECGLGKTITMATHLMNNKIDGSMDLIVCPLSLMEQWKRELKRVYKGNGLRKPKILLFHGPNRIQKFQSKSRRDFIITTYSILASSPLEQLKWGRVVLDESHMIRNGLQSKKPKAAAAAYIVGKHSKYNWCMSATPFCNRMKDIASQCKFIGTQPYNDPKWWKKNGNNDDEVHEWRKKFILRRTKENIIPPPLYHDIEVTPTRREKKLVDKLRAKAQEKFDKWKRSHGLTKIKLQGQILSLIQRLRVVSNSYYCGEDEIDGDKVLHDNAKVNMMMETLDRKLWDDPTHSVVIFSQFTSYLDILQKIIEENMIGVEVMKFFGSMSSSERDEVVNDFTTSTHPRVLLVSLMAGGCGLNLMPCATVFLSEPYFNPFMEKQAEERVHRIGQEHQVNVYRFSLSNSVETWINGLKHKKRFLASGLDLLYKHEKTPVDFSFADLADLFADLVGFNGDEKSKKRVTRGTISESTPPISESNSHEYGWDVECEKCSECFWTDDGNTWVCEKCTAPQINEHDTYKIGIDCSICLDDCGTKKACNLGCGHIFHSDCIDEWKNINDSCPMCKRPIRIL